MEFLPDSGHAVPNPITQTHEQTTPPNPTSGFKRLPAKQQIGIIVCEIGSSAPFMNRTLRMGSQRLDQVGMSAPRQSFPRAAPAP